MEKISEELKEQVIEFFRFIDKKYFATRYDLNYDSFYRLVTGSREMTMKYYKELEIHIDDFKNKIPTT